MNLHHRKKLIADVCARGDMNSLTTLFEETTREWPYFMRHVEGGTISSFDDLICEISPEVAFHLVPKAAQLALDQQRPELCDTALSLAIDLARRSNTTEIPTDLKALLTRLKQSSTSKFRLVDYLLEWYRLAV